MHAVSCDGSRIVCALSNGNVHVWDDDSGKQIAVPPEIQNVHYVFCAVVSSDGSGIVSGSREGVVVVRYVDSTERSMRNMAGHTCIRCVAVSSDGRVAVSGSDDRTIRIRDDDKGEMMGAPLMAHTNYFTHVAVSADCNEDASASFDRTLWVWDVQRSMDMSHDAARPDNWSRLFCIRWQCVASCFRVR